MSTVEEINAQAGLQRAKNEKLKYVQPIVLLVILGVLLAIIFGTLAYSHGEFLLKLRDIETARGLITFLVAVTAVAIALVLAVYVMASTESREEIKERFTFAKDVLSTLIGILGTVLGFYYGSLSQNQDQQLAFDSQVRGTQLIGHITGAVSPYRYTIAFPGDKADKVTFKASKDGWISETLPGTLKNNDSIQIEILDAKEKKLSKAIKYAPEEKSVVTPVEGVPVVPPSQKPAAPAAERPVVAPAPTPAPKASQ
jgi:hypothetical protein